MKKYFAVPFSIALVFLGLIIIRTNVLFVTSGNSQFGLKKLTLVISVILLLIAAFIPLFRRQQLSHWSLEHNQYLILLFFCGILMNGFLFVNNPNMGGDSLRYHSAFHNLVSGKGWLSYDGSWARVDPGYGMLAYVFYMIFGDIEYSGMIVSSLGYLLMIPAVFSTVNFLFGKKTAVLASMSITFFPVLVSYSYINLTDCVFTFLLFMSFSLFIRILLDKGTPFTHALLGLSLGLTYLVRAAEGLLVAGLVLFSLIVQAILQLRHTKKEKQFFAPTISKPQMWSIATLFLFAIVALPYILFLHEQTGMWTFSARIRPVSNVTSSQPDNDAIISDHQVDSDTTVSTAVAPQVSDSTTETAIDLQKPQFEGLFDAYQPSIISILDNMKIFFIRLAKINSYATIPFALLCIAFPFLAKRKIFAFMNKLYTLLKPDSRNARILLSLAIFSSPALIHLSVSALHSERWFMQYSIYLLIVIAFVTISFLESMLAVLEWKHDEIWVILLCLITVVTSLNLNSPTLFEKLTSSHAHLGLRAAGLWLEDNAHDPPNLNILAPKKSYVASFYASGKQFNMGNSQDINTDLPPDEVLKGIGILLNSGNIDYMVLDNFYTHSKGPLTPLWHDPDIAQKYGYSLLHRDSGGLFQIYGGN